MCCRDNDDFSDSNSCSVFAALIGLALAGVVGLTLLLVGCALPEYGSWWPLFVVFFYILAPIPTAIARRFNYDAPTTTPCMEFAIFATTGIVVSAFALPAVLAHAGTIRWGACFFTNTASTIFFLAIVAYYYMNHEDGWNAAIY
uniref:MARVEL domain-containing protein n=1 Tax=Panagrellus redivivus TaxID=6233 RepID=A0A7E4VWG4_PANRE